MFEFARPLQDLIEELKKLPGVGAKSAQRMAFHLLAAPAERSERLAEVLLEARRSVAWCSVCNNITREDPCALCSDPNRTDDQLCVVEEPVNVGSIEKTGAFHGRYHVLLGALSPLKGVGPDELRADKLLKRLESGRVAEVILATNPTVEGEATAVYLCKLLRARPGAPLRITRLAMGLPVGSDLDFADQVTIKKSLEGRTELKD